MVGARRACYGIAEIADSVGVGRQLVAAWRRRRSHGMPEPDAQLASGPVWLGSTIEPWIDQLPARPVGPESISSQEVRRVARRVLRLLALLLEDPPRAALVSRAIAEARELLSLVNDGDDDRDPARAGVIQVLAPVADSRYTDKPGDDSGPDASAELDELRRRLLMVLPVLADLVLSLEAGARARTVAG